MKGITNVIIIITRINDKFLMTVINKFFGQVLANNAPARRIYFI